MPPGDPRYTLNGRIEKAGQKAGMLECPNCRHWFRRQHGGYKNHLAACDTKLQEQSTMSRRDRKEQRRALEAKFEAQMQLQTVPNLATAQNNSEDMDVVMDSSPIVAPQPTTCPDFVPGSSRQLKRNDNRNAPHHAESGSDFADNAQWIDAIPDLESLHLDDESIPTACVNNLTTVMDHNPRYNPSDALDPLKSTTAPSNSSGLSQPAGSVPVPTLPPNNHGLPPESNNNDWWMQGLCVRIHWHPSSYRPDEMYAIDKYLAVRNRQTQPVLWKPVFADGNSPSESDSQAPFYPFKSLVDFEFADYVMSSGLSNSKTDSLLTYIQSSWSTGGSKISFKSHRDIQAVFDTAHSESSELLFQEHTATSSYRAADGQKVTESFSFWCRPIMPLLKKYFSDPIIGSVMEQYPSKRYLLRDGQVFDLIDDIDCGSDWWDIQDEIGTDGFLAAMKFYSDATQINRFRDASFHPVSLVLANVPHYLRNSLGVGGSLLVANIPEIITPKTESNNASFVDFKNDILHQVFDVVLSTIRIPSAIGESICLANGLQCVMYPTVYIVSVDYLEQISIAGTRGKDGRLPCPICEIPASELDRRHEVVPYREAAQNMKLYSKTQRMLQQRGQITAAKESLTAKSLRPIKNAFWNITFTDIHQALSFDLGHAFDSGIVKHVLFATFTALARRSNGSIDPEVLAIIDDRNSQLEPYSHLHQHQVHEQITSKKFADQRVWVSIFLRVLPSLHDGAADNLPKRDLKKLLRFIRLLGSIRAIMDIRTLTQEHCDIQLDQTKEVSNLIPDVSIILQKNFKFPKMHAFLDHALQHMLRKGPLKDLNSMHGEHLHTVFKNDAQKIRRGKEHETAKQLSSIEENRYILRTIKQCIAITGPESAAFDSLAVDENTPVSNRLPASPAEQPSCDAPSDPQLDSSPSFHSFEGRLPALAMERKKRGESSESDAVFYRFRIELRQFLRETSGKHDLEWLDKNEVIETFKALDSHYRSHRTLEMTEVTSRVADSYWHHRRRDVVLLRFPADHNRYRGRYVFARLHALFRCWAADQEWDLARVTFFKTIEKPSVSIIGMRRIREDTGGCFVKTSWVIRTVNAAPTFDGNTRDRYVIDLTDGDAYFRLLDIEGCQCI